tara:strand:+ start:26227 stop:26580 length:354 start_codon:yes stop_codon:yes gene_type:complete
MERMKIKKNVPPRQFNVGEQMDITINHCANINLDPDEQVTFLTNNDREYDVVRKDWGFYATPSINGRLKNFGFKTALVKNTDDLYYIMIVEESKEKLFQKYIKDTKQILIEWLNEKV